MGRMLGAHDNADALDRPDLNKCPNCGCFFAQDTCPLCGKVCPEEMRAGNRKPVKQKRVRYRSDRVTFVEWYHSWWFIILMLVIFPIVGIVLLATSPHKRSVKLTIIAVAVVYTVISSVGIGNIVSRITSLWDKPVDTSMDRGEYMSVCETMDAETLYRDVEGYQDDFVCVTLTVVEKITDIDGYYANKKYTTYYICRDMSGETEFLIRDCQQDGAKNFLAGDVITVYGEVVGNVTIHDMAYIAHHAPCINMAYVTRENNLYKDFYFGQ